MNIITFSGIDGAGKSTQIELLRRSLLEGGHAPEFYTFWDDIVAFRKLRDRASTAVFNGDPGVGSPERPIRRRDKNVRSWYLTLSRLALYTADAFRLRWISWRYWTRSGIVIVDRYLHDELANLPSQNPLIRIYMQLLLALIPRPSLALLLDADPESAAARKPEYPLEFMRENRAAYLRLASLTGMSVIPPDSVEETSRHIRALVSCLQTPSQISVASLPSGPSRATSAPSARSC